MEQLTKILERLNQQQVEYVLVGGLAAVMHGSTLATRDVDVCIPFTRENLERLETALSGLNPVHRQTPQKLPFSVAADFPRGLKNLYLRTELGVLDCLGEIAGIGDFDETVRRSTVVELPVGRCRILDLAALIESKQTLNREHDRVAVAQLKAISQRPKSR